MKLFAIILFNLSMICFGADHAFDIKDGAGKIVGTGSYSESKQGVKLSIDLKGVQPGIRGMHIHDKGICQGPKFETSGGHLNPGNKKHGKHGPDGGHLGDLGNIEIPENGNLKKEIMLKGFDLKIGSAHSLITTDGTSLMIHAKNDDEKTDPSGGSGDRMYCGVLSEAQKGLGIER